MLQLQGTAYEQPPEFLCRARRPLSSNWAPTGIALSTENSWIPEVHGSLNSRSGQEHGNPPSPTSLGQWVCCPGFLQCSVLSNRKDKIWKQGLWPAQAQQEAGALTKAGETLVGRSKLWSMDGNWKPVLGLYWLASASLLLISLSLLTRFYWPAWACWPDLLTHNL